MSRHKLVLNGDVVRVFTNGKSTRLGYNKDKTSDIRGFIRDSGLSEAEVDQKMKELFSIGETEISDKV